MDKEIGELTEVFLYLYHEFLHRSSALFSQEKNSMYAALLGLDDLIASKVNVILTRA